MVTRSALEAVRRRADAQAKGRRRRLLQDACRSPHPRCGDGSAAFGMPSEWRSRSSLDLFVPNAVGAWPPSGHCSPGTAIRIVGCLLDAR